MTMYKSTGKEFDGVVLIEGKYRSPSASVTGARFGGIRSAQSPGGPHAPAEIEGGVRRKGGD